MPKLMDLSTERMVSEGGAMGWIREGECGAGWRMRRNMQGKASLGGSGYLDGRIYPVLCRVQDGTPVGASRHTAVFWGVCG